MTGSNVVEAISEYTKKKRKPDIEFSVSIIGPSLDKWQTTKVDAPCAGTALTKAIQMLGLSDATQFQIKRNTPVPPVVTPPTQPTKRSA